MTRTLLLLCIGAWSSCTPQRNEEPSGGRRAVGQAATAPELGTTQSFADLGASTVTNTGSSVITGDLGLSPGTAVTGFPPGLVLGGTIQAASAGALQAQNDATTAFNALAAQACEHDLTGQDLGGLTLTAGSYCFSSSAQLTGALTLNAEGDPAAVFVFQIGSTLIAASSSSVLMTNGGKFCNVFWQVGSSATIGTSSAFKGTIVALTSITLTTGAKLNGRALARNGAVTLDTNDVSPAGCSPAGGGADAGAGGAGGGAADAGAGGGVGGGAGGGVGGAGGVGGGRGGGAGGGTGGGAGGGAGGGSTDAGSHTHGHDGGSICDQVCLDTDHDNCGSCGNVCGLTETCVAGACVCLE